MIEVCLLGMVACRAEEPADDGPTDGSSADGRAGELRAGEQRAGEQRAGALRFEERSAGTVERGSSGRFSAVGFAGKLRFDLQLEPGVPAVGQIFRVLVDVRDLETGKPIEGDYYSLDATMPEHAHGMSTQPSHRRLRRGRFSSEGLKFHMPGLWHFEARVEGRTVAGKVIADRVLVPFEQPLVAE